MSLWGNDVGALIGRWVRHPRCGARSATYNGAQLTGGFDDQGNAHPAGTNFCDRNRPDLNQCD